MKVFLSWSGDLSHSVAVALREWLPSVIQDTDPYVSSEDIDKGTRWSTDIAKELEASAYGILCITPENLTAPWIHFEAGALSKQIDKARVCPFLFRVKRAEVDGPLLQFQSTIYEQEDMRKLVASINKACGPKQLEEQRLSTTFDVWWPHLQRILEALPAATPLLENEETTPAKSPPDTKMLEEILDLVRTQQKILRSPSDLLPPDYLRAALPGHRSGMANHRAWHELHIRLREIVDIAQIAKNIPDDRQDRQEYLEHLSKQAAALSDLAHMAENR